MKRLVYSPLATRNLRSLTRYIAADDPVRAMSFVDELRTEAAKAAERPQSFPEHPVFGPGVRVARYKPYLILFREYRDHVRIIRVVHGARKLPMLRNR